MPAAHPVALIEPQAYAGRDVDAFWLADRGFYAMALGTDVLASNQGHVLWSVWPHDTALIAAGLRRHGFRDDFRTLFDALVDAAAAAPAHRLPELFGAHARVPGEPFVSYPVACRPQARAAGVIPFLLAEGLRGPRPQLPSGVRELALDRILRATSTARGEVQVAWL